MATMSKEVLSAKTLKDLKKLASELNIIGRSRKNKKDLIDLIFEHDPKSKKETEITKPVSKPIDETSNIKRTETRSQRKRHQGSMEVEKARINGSS